MKTPAQADVQRWSDEVARDPRSVAFLPLARAYRKQGLRDAAIALCLRGLEAHPSHVEAHGLLAKLYLESGDHERAADEWSIVLRIDGDNFEALRGMGFCFLEQDRLSRARQLLERAALRRPADATVQEALRVLGMRQDLVEQGLSTRPDVALSDDPWLAFDGGPRFMLDLPSAAEAASPASAAEVGTGATAPMETRAAGGRGAPHAESRAPAPQRTQLIATQAEPTLLFDDLLSQGPLLGALLVDAHGLVLAGRLTEAVAGDAAVMGAVLGGAIDEATRTARHLTLGAWRGILLDCEYALLHLMPARDAVLVLAARRDAPAGWILRTAAHAVEQAQRYMEEYA